MYEKGKMRPVETIPGIGGGWIQLWYIVRSFVNVTVYPQYSNNMILKINKKKNKGPIYHFAFIYFFLIWKNPTVGGTALAFLLSATHIGS
jgi:hypothetical protein